MDYFANQYLRGTGGLETILNLEECKEKKPLEWRSSLNNINRFLEKWAVVQRLNIQQFATKELVEILVQHLFLLEDQEEWIRKRCKSEALRPRDNRSVSKILSRNRSMIENPNYTVLDSSSSSGEDPQENSFNKVKQSLVATGNNKISISLLLLVQHVVKVKRKVEIQCQNTSIGELKQLAQRQSKLRDIAINRDTVSYLGFGRNDNKDSIGSVGEKDFSE